MYTLIIYLYRLGVMTASLFNEKVRKMWHGERAAFSVLKQKVDPTARYIWFHAASLGEFEQGRPIIEQLRREHPEYKILLTFFSPSGYEVRKNYEGADIICYLPLDTPRNARRFLRLVRPCMAFFIKYEFWYNYLHILKHRGVPTYSVSSIFRPGQVFFRWYGRQYGRVLKCFTRFFVQNEVSRELLESIGITNVDVTGDTRFDRVLQIMKQAKVLPIVEEFVGDASPVFVAGSSWQPDEEIFLKYFREHPEWKLIIAPHVISEDHLLQIETLCGKENVVRYTQVENNSLTPHPSPLTSHPSPLTPHLSPLTSHPSPFTSHPSPLTSKRMLLIDCFGLLSSIYRYADVAYVGGGFGVGIHNLPEAAVWGVPVFFGPNNERFQEAQDLKQNGGGIEIHSYDDFATHMDELTSHPAECEERGDVAAQYVEGRAGATEAILKKVSSAFC